MAVSGVTFEIDIYMARVGESEAIAKGLLAGNQLNDTPLSEKGQGDARNAGDNLARILKEKGVKEVRVFTADEVLRMQQTTNLIIEQLKQAGMTCHRQSDHRLGGKNHGIFNASTKEERTQNPEKKSERLHRDQLTPEERFKTPIKGGESKQDIAVKTSLLFQEIYQNRSTGAVVIVASNNTVEALTAQLNPEKPYEKMKVAYLDIVHLKQSKEKLQFIRIYEKV